MVKQKTMKLSSEFHRKIMKMKYDLGYKDAEDLLKSLVAIAQKVSSADELKPKIREVGLKNAQSS